jgi:hypothetical protein
MKLIQRRLVRWVAAIALGATVGTAHALSFDIPFGDSSIEGVSNTTLTAGVALRTEKQADDLIAKGHLNPDVCGRVDGKLYWSSCQGIFREQSFMAAHLAQAPGAATSNTDQGNLNYDRGDITQAPIKLSQDLKLTYGDFGLFIKGLYFYDPVNYNFTEYHPNRVTQENVLRVGNVSTPGTELVRQTGGAPLPLPVFVARSDSRPCGARNPNPGQPCGIVYGKGEVVYSQRTDSETLREIGRGFQLLEASFFGQLPLPYDKKLNFKVGRQLVNWGESTVMFFDSLNVVNPINANNLFRVGGSLDEVFIPINMVSLSMEVFPSGTLSGFYQLEWEPLQTPAPGSFYSPVNIGTNNAGNKYLTLGFGQTPDDPDRVEFLLDNPLSGVTPTSGQVQRLEDREPRPWRQFGVSLKYYADWLGNGTDLGAYYMQYHSRTPFVSVYSVPNSCGTNVTDTASFQLACPDIPLTHAQTTANDPQYSRDHSLDGMPNTGDATNFDKVKVFLEYPESIHLLGLSFSTTVGSISMQGEVAYRPHEPLQVSTVDLAFAAYGTALDHCDRPEQHCAGTGKGGVAGGGLPVGLPLPNVPGGTGLGVMQDGSVGTYGSSDYVIDAQGTPGAFNDTFDLIIGHGSGSGRSFPSFIIPYRGMRPGDNPPSSYIRGWEYFQTFSFDLGTTYVQGASDFIPSLIGADQLISLFEFGARWVPGLPSLDTLQLDGPGIFYHASAGADGSGADRSRQACSYNPDGSMHESCSYGPDGLRFNPHQQDRSLYPTKLSGGYAMVAQIKYESILPGISLAPLILFKHDVYGHSPGQASNFIEGRMLFDGSLEIRYKSALSFNLGYQIWAGGGEANQLRDRDNARFFIKYQL